MCFFFFPVLDPYRLVISFIALIHIVCCLKMYFHQRSNHVKEYCFLLEVFQDKCNRDCSRDYFQCCRIRLHCILFIRNRNRIQQVASNRNRLYL